jgi:hypothetical protein
VSGVGRAGPQPPTQLATGHAADDELPGFLLCAFCGPKKGNPAVLRAKKREEKIENLELNLI